jgi:CRISPR/Cas system CMR-associated protein Cmr5 small subunit
MKPSEYLLKKDFFGYNIDKELCIKCNTVRGTIAYNPIKEEEILKLDKRFIDREELKEKINKLKKNVRYQKGDDITDMILELLK